MNTKPQLGMRPEWANFPQLHNSDITLFMRCRRKWSWEGRHQRWLQPSGAPAPALWFGSGFHYALEDFHGYHVWPNPGDALWAYTEAFPKSQRPDNWETLIDTGEHMLNYYATEWVHTRKEFDTLWIDGVPQCEVDFAVKIPGMKLVFAGTFDRIVKDVYGRLWVLDWKTAAKFDSVKWQTDPQVTRYSWAASQLYGKRFEGVIMVQFKKTWPRRPSVLKQIHKPTGLPKVSQNKQESTSYELYKQTLEEVYGVIPEDYVDHLNWLADQEDDRGNQYIRWDQVRRSPQFQDSEPERMREIIRDYFDPNIRIYPNPTNECYPFCAFRAACLAKDDGMDYEHILENDFESRHSKDFEGWRDRLVLPDNPRYRPPPRPAPRPDDDLTDEEFLELLLGDDAHIA